MSYATPQSAGSLLAELTSSEAVYTQDLSYIIKKAASAWSRRNFPPKELDQVFRVVEACYKASKAVNNALVGTTPQTLEGTLSSLVAQLIAPAYGRYSNQIILGFDTFEPVQSNANLRPILESFEWPAASITAGLRQGPELSGILARLLPATDLHAPSLDALFVLPIVRLVYYRRLLRALIGMYPGLQTAYETVAGLVDTSMGAAYASRAQLSGGASPVNATFVAGSATSPTHAGFAAVGAAGTAGAVGAAASAKAAYPPRDSSILSPNSTATSPHATTFSTSTHNTSPTGAFFPASSHPASFAEASDDLSPEEQQLLNATEPIRSATTDRAALPQPPAIQSQPAGIHHTQESANGSHESNATSFSPSLGPSSTTTPNSDYDDVWPKKQAAPSAPQSAAPVRRPTQPLANLERRLDTSGTLDIFTMRPRACKLQIWPPNHPFHRELRTEGDCILSFTPQSDPARRRIVVPNAYIFLLTDLFLVCEWKDGEIITHDGVPQDLALLYPPLAGKHLRVHEGERMDEIAIEIMRKEVITLRASSISTAQRWRTAFEEAVAFGNKPTKGAPAGAPLAGSAVAPASSLGAPAERREDARSVSPAHSGGGMRGAAIAGGAAVAGGVAIAGGAAAATATHYAPLSANGRSASASGFSDRGGYSDRSGYSDRAPGYTDRSVSANGYNGQGPTANGYGSSRQNGMRPPPINTGFGYPQQSVPSPNAASPGVPKMIGDFPTTSPIERRQQQEQLGLSHQFNSMNLNIPASSSTQSLGPGGYSSHLGAYPPGSAPHSRATSPSEGLLSPQGPGGMNPGSRSPLSGSYPYGLGRGQQSSASSSTSLSTTFRLPSEAYKGHRAGLESEFDVEGDMLEERLNSAHSPANVSAASTTNTEPIKLGPMVQKATMKCKTFLQQSPSQWKNLGTGHVLLYQTQDGMYKQLVVQGNARKISSPSLSSGKNPHKNTLISTIVIPDGVERMGKTGLAIEVADAAGNRTGVIYMLKLHTGESATLLYDQIRHGGGKR